MTITDRNGQIRFKRGKAFLVMMATVGPTATMYSCSATLGASLRDAAIEGAATFVETATTEALDRWFGQDANGP